MGTLSLMVAPPPIWVMLSADDAVVLVLLPMSRLLAVMSGTTVKVISDTTALARFCISDDSSAMAPWLSKGVISRGRVVRRVVCVGMPCSPEAGCDDAPFDCSDFFSSWQPKGEPVEAYTSPSRSARATLVLPFSFLY